MIKLLDIKGITAEHRDEYLSAISRVIDSGWFLQGEEITHFETEYAEYIGTKNCITTANGLDALYLLLHGYKELGVIKDGDEIIVPANTYIATILAITRNNLCPVLVEPNMDTLEIDEKRIEDKITLKTAGLMIVHLYGRIAYSEAIRSLCKKHNLLLFEDCAQSHGCRWRGHLTGSLGDGAAHSFYPGKNLGAFGDAGAVTTNNDELANIIRALANYGSHKKYVFKYTGINSRMSEIDAAILRIKLKFLDSDNKRRQKIAALYYENISNPLITLPSRLIDENNVYHQFPIFCKRRDALQSYLTEFGIQTLIHYPIPPHKQECYPTWNNCSFPITEKIHREELSIPINQALTTSEANEIISIINAFE